MNTENVDDKKLGFCPFFHDYVGWVYDGGILDFILVLWFFLVIKIHWLYWFGWVWFRIEYY